MMKAQPDSSDSLVFECDLDEPPEKVWRALTEPELLRAWLGHDELGAKGQSGPKAGPPETQVALATDGPLATEGPRIKDSTRCDILSAEPHSRLRYRWRDREHAAGDGESREIHSVVTVELTPACGGGTHLRLTHGEFRIVASSLASTCASVVSFAAFRRRPAEGIRRDAPISRNAACRSSIAPASTPLHWRRAA